MSRIAPDRSRPVYGSHTPSAPPVARAKPKESRGFFGLLTNLFTFDFLKSEPAKPRLVREFEASKNSVLIERAGDLAFVDGGAFRLEDKHAGTPPDAETFQQLAPLNRPVVTLSRSATGATFGLITPAGFDPRTSGAMNVRTVTPPTGSSVADVVRALAKDPPNLPNTIIVVSDREKPAARAESQVLEHLLHLSADFGTHQTLALSSGESQWSATIAANQGAKSAPLLGPIVSHADGTWAQFPPTTNHTVRFPNPGQVEKSQTIPKAMQKQSAERGAFLTPIIKSEALGSTVRAGVYLPPGYDPDKSEKYPVLVMLPGKKDALHYWTSVGQLVGKLDHMMKGDAQKMIVVVADGNESYFVNDEPDEKEGRNYQDYVVKELVDYATTKLAGDKKKLSIAGISRGGYGAVVAAAEHPGLFNSVSSHSGALGEQRNPKSSHNPTTLIREGAFDKHAPRLMMDIGVNDPYFVPETIELAALMASRGTDVDTHVFEASTGAGDKHNWNLWGPALESWIGYHQETYGTPGEPRSNPPTKDVAADRIAARQAQSKQSYKELGNILTDSTAGNKRTTGALVQLKKNARAIPDAAKVLNLPALESAVETANDAVASIHQLLDGPRGLFDTQKASTANQAIANIERAEALVSRAAADLAALQAMPKAARDDVAATITAEPRLRAPVFGLAARRPALFNGVDPVTNKAFASQLRHHVEKFLTEKDVPGFGEFLERMTTGTYKWKVGGYSHSVCASLTTWINHPGLVLDIIEAAKNDTAYPLHHVYDGNGAPSLRPIADLRHAWRPIVQSKGDDAFTDNPAVLKGTEFRYERGLLRALVDEMKPERLTADRMARRCDPVAVALHRLTGVETRYTYAFNIKTGNDLATALRSQNGEGLAMADVHFGHDAEKLDFSHFPVFFDYDEATNTCWWQDFSSRPPKRLELDGLHFVTEGKTRPAIYYRPSEGIEPLLTIEEQRKSQSIGLKMDFRWGEREQPTMKK